MSWPQTNEKSERVHVLQHALIYLNRYTTTGGGFPKDGHLPTHGTFDTFTRAATQQALRDWGIDPARVTDPVGDLTAFARAWKWQGPPDYNPAGSYVDDGDTALVGTNGGGLHIPTVGVTAHRSTGGANSMLLWGLGAAVLVTLLLVSSSDEESVSTAAPAAAIPPAR